MEAQREMAEGGIILRAMPVCGCAGEIVVAKLLPAFEPGLASLEGFSSLSLRWRLRSAKNKAARRIAAGRFV